MLGLAPRDLIRRKEAAYRENGLDDPAVGDDALLAAMAAHPILIERPIVVAGARAPRWGARRRAALAIL